MKNVGPKTIKRMAKDLKVIAKEHGHNLRTHESQEMVTSLMTGKKWQDVAAKKENPSSTIDLAFLRKETEIAVNNAFFAMSCGGLSTLASLKENLVTAVHSICSCLEEAEVAERVYAETFGKEFQFAGEVPAIRFSTVLDFMDGTITWHRRAVENYLVSFGYGKALRILLCRGFSRAAPHINSSASLLVASKRYVAERIKAGDFVAFSKSLVEGKSKEGLRSFNQESTRRDIEDWLYEEFA